MEQGTAYLLKENSEDDLNPQEKDMRDVNIWFFQKLFQKWYSNNPFKRFG